MEETKKKEASAEKEAPKTAAKEKTAEAKAEKAEKKKLRETEAALAEKEAELAAAAEALAACEDKYMRMMAEYDIPPSHRINSIIFKRLLHGLKPISHITYLPILSLYLWLQELLIHNVFD